LLVSFLIAFSCASLAPLRQARISSSDSLVSTRWCLSGPSACIHTQCRCVCIVRAGNPPARTKRGVKVDCLLLYPALFYQWANVSAIRSATGDLVFTWCDRISLPRVGEPHSGYALDHRHLSVMEEMIESSRSIRKVSSYRCPVEPPPSLGPTRGAGVASVNLPPRLLIFDTTGMSA
jgi:hypothetical protein